MLFAIPFPVIDPVLVQIGPFAIRWYALAYITGIVLGWMLARRLVALPPVVATRQQVDDFVTWATLGIILGGRLGYVLFYRAEHYLSHPLEILQVWQGGMSFHGGALGVIVALVALLPAAADRLAGLRRPRHRGGPDRPLPRAARQLHQRRALGPRHRRALGHGLPDRRAGAAPPEPALPGRVGRRGAVHPAAGAGARPAPIRARRGFVAGAFLAGYGVARSIGEFFRQPDAFLGFLFAGATMGQLLSVPMILVGAWLMLRARPAPRAVAA